MVGGQSTECGFEAGRLDRRAGKAPRIGTRNWTTALAGGADCHFCRADDRVFQAVTTESPAMGIRAVLVACGWIVMSLSVRQTGLLRATRGRKQDARTSRGRRRRRTKTRGTAETKIGDKIPACSIGTAGKSPHRRCGSRTWEEILCRIKNKSGPVPCGSGSRTRNGWCPWPESRPDFW